MDPVTIIGGATVAFNALKKGFQFGKDLQEMGGQLNQWASSMSDLSYLEQKNKNPPWWKSLGGSVEAEALEIFTAKKKAYAKGGRVAMYNVGGMVKSSGPMNTGIAKPKNTYK